MKRLLLLIISILCGYFANGQLLKKFDLEIASNYSIVFNKGRFLPQKYYSTIDTFYDQRPTYFLNYNLSLGYSINKNSTIRLKYGRNYVGVKLTCKKIIKSDVFGDDRTVFFINYTNKLEVSYIGMQYQYKCPIEKDHLLFSIGIDRQEIHYVMADILFNDFASPNYALEASIGYQMELIDKLSAIGRFYMINAFSQKNSDVYFNLPSSFAPFQIGIEFALRKYF
jgi:hypothetical protein